MTASSLSPAPKALKDRQDHKACKGLPASPDLRDQLDLLVPPDLKAYPAPPAHKASKDSSVRKAYPAPQDLRDRKATQDRKAQPDQPVRKDLRDLQDLSMEWSTLAASSTT